uniref:Peptidase S1 domain-containing protein n=1 Tax=Trichuris muris TaxID=70415 RepID=A0A5S6QWV5_TRIMR
MFLISTTFLIVIGSLSTFVNCWYSSPWDVAGCGRVLRPNVNSAVNESDADAAHHPWMALLTQEGGEHCHGILLPSSRVNTSSVVVVSASCQRKTSTDKQRVVTGIGPDGRLDGNHTKTASVVGVLSGSGHCFDDVAFVLFSPEVHFNEHVKPVCLPRQSTPPPNSPCLLAGYSIERAEDGSHGISKVQLKETALMVRRQNRGTFMGSYFFYVHNITSKTDVTHFKGTPLVCLHNGLWTLYGTIIPLESLENEFVFADVYSRLQLLEGEMELPKGPFLTFLSNLGLWD